MQARRQAGDPPQSHVAVVVDGGDGEPVGRVAAEVIEGLQADARVVLVSVAAEGVRVQEWKRWLDERGSVVPVTVGGMDDLRGYDLLGRIAWVGVIRGAVVLVGEVRTGA